MTAAQRAKRHRARRRKGVAVLPVEVGEATYCALALAGLLPESDLSNSSAVAQALGTALREWTKQSFRNALREGPRGHCIVTSS